MRKSAELRKAEIVAAVLDLADRIGPDRVTTGAAAAAVGVSQAALFRHFPENSPQDAVDSRRSGLGLQGLAVLRRSTGRACLHVSF